MSVLIPQRPARATPSGGEYFPISVAKCHEMIAKGVLTEDDAVELLEGLLVRKTTKIPPREAVCYLVRVALEKQISEKFHMKVGGPFTTSDSGPEPDLSVIRGDTRDFLARHPGPEDVALVTEVSDSSLGRDRGIKKRVYAHAQTPVYGLVNMESLSVEVYSDPVEKGRGWDYKTKTVYAKKDALPLVVDNREAGRIPVKELLS